MRLKYLFIVFHKISNGIHHFPLKGTLIFIFFGGVEVLGAKNMVLMVKSIELFFLVIYEAYINMCSFSFIVFFSRCNSNFPY